MSILNLKFWIQFLRARKAKNPVSPKNWELYHFSKIVQHSSTPPRACFQTRRSPLAPLNKGGTRALKVPLFKGDLGGSPGFFILVLSLMISASCKSSSNRDKVLCCGEFADTVTSAPPPDCDGEMSRWGSFTKG